MQQINQSSRNIYTPYVPIWNQSHDPLPWRVMQAVGAIFLNLTIALSNGIHYFFEAFARNDNDHMSPPAYTPPLPDYMMDDNPPAYTPPSPDYMMDERRERN
ncbi:MAG TPA: hypothetical protein VLE95_05815 [Chlamydiales bacterium]|nr:hypothetical protein [Chlamydiales bacterium]